MEEVNKPKWSINETVQKGGAVFRVLSRKNGIVELGADKDPFLLKGTSKNTVEALSKEDWAVAENKGQDKKREKQRTMVIDEERAVTGVWVGVDELCKTHEGIAGTPYKVKYGETRISLELDDAEAEKNRVYPLRGDRYITWVSPLNVFRKETGRCEEMESAGVKNIFVNEEQGKGLAQVLVARWIACMAERGVTGLALETTDTSGGFWSLYGLQEISASVPPKKISAVKEKINDVFVKWDTKRETSEKMQ
jgi:hypothetical protein